MEIPEKWRGYDCAEYFAGDWHEGGFLDDHVAMIWVIVSLAEVYEDAAGFLAVRSMLLL
jgi:hypothetical protein